MNPMQLKNLNYINKEPTKQEH